MDTWRQKNPDYVYRLWTDPHRCDGKLWIHQAQIDASPSWAGKADLMRYEILLKWGGVYTDADSECLKPLDSLFLTETCWAAFENEVKAPGIIANGTLGSEPSSMLMMRIVQECATVDVRNQPAWKCTGPLLLTRVAEKFRGTKDELKVFPSRTFYPQHWSGTPAPGDAPIFARQFWGSTNKLYEKLSNAVP